MEKRRSFSRVRICFHFFIASETRIERLQIGVDLGKTQYLQLSVVCLPQSHKLKDIATFRKKSATNVTNDSVCFGDPNI